MARLGLLPGDVQVAAFERKDGDLQIDIVVDSVVVRSLSLPLHHLREYRRLIAAAAIIRGEVPAPIDETLPADPADRIEHRWTGAQGRGAMRVATA